MGGSGGGMMTQAMLAVYPDLFSGRRGARGRPGWMLGEWLRLQQSMEQQLRWRERDHDRPGLGRLVREMYPGYTGHRPRLQTYQGDADTTISYKNTGEAIKEWTNVLGLPTTPTSTQTGYKGAEATWNIQRWANACGYNVFEAWTSPGAGHSMNYEEAEMLQVLRPQPGGRGPDPEPDCTGGAGGAGGGAGGGGGGGTGTGGTVGTGGAVGTGGSAGHAGTGGTGGTGGAAGIGGLVGSGGSPGSGGSSATGGNNGSGGIVGTGGTVGSGGSSAEGGASGTGTGGEPGSGGSVGSGGSSGTGSGGSGSMQVDTSSSGCSCAVGSDGQRPVSMVTPLLLAALGLMIRRRQGRPRPPSR